MEFKVKSMISVIMLTISNVGQNSCATINDTNILLQDILIGYNKNVRPVENQSNAVEVKASFLLISIQELDEIRGIFSVMGVLLLTWHDANMVWNPDTYGGIENVLTSYKEVWVPELILINPAEELDTLGKKWQRVYFDQYGNASWSPGDFIKSTCSVNVYKYPFDSQECILSFNAWGYFAGQVKINPRKDQIDLRYFTESPTWKLARSKANSFTVTPQIQFHVYLERKAGFVIVNMILPLTFLSLLNAFVFLLDSNSGERVSYCITVLLSIAVFMTIVSDTLPKSSEPVPAISYKLIFDIVNSSLITAVTILNLRLYHKCNTENVPRWIHSIYLFLYCKRSKFQGHPVKEIANDMNNLRNQPKFEHLNRNLDLEGSEQRQSKYMSDVFLSRNPSANVTDLKEFPAKHIGTRLAGEISEVTENGETQISVSWKDVSNMVDVIAFIVFILLSVFSFLIFMIITRSC